MFLARLRTRERIPERMDDPALDPAAHLRALAALARINRVSGSAGVLWPAVAKLAARLGRTVHLLDVATGSGDVPRALLQRAKRAGIDLRVSACDISLVALEEAARRTPGANFFPHNAVTDPLPTGFDVVTCSLFLHHLSDDEAVAVLANMRAAGGEVLVNDLARSRFGFCGVWAASHLLTTSRVVWFDGPASVRSAFTPTEALALARRAGLTGATVAGKFPARFLLSWGAA
ncbi:MAG: methyltransferase domain-containing protein [Gemmataceae bacterium]|nr:methyltransferase domain-containing protein [Gemmataceae bacterium]